MENDIPINWKEKYFELVARFEALEAENRALKTKVQELLEKLNTNSKNSSKPPSQDPSRKKNKSKPTGKKQGGQLGHPGHKRTLHPIEKVTSTIEIKPEYCPNCSSTTFECTPISIECRQVIELPEIQAEVTQYNIHTCKCGQCGKHIYPNIPKEAERGFGPRLMGFVTMLTGEGHVTKRKICSITSYLGLKISLGALCNIHKLATKILEEPFNVIHKAVLKEININADETSWRLLGNRCWLWIGATTKATFFKIDPSRSQQAFKKIFSSFENNLTCDRYGAYNSHKGSKQICLAHIARDIEKMSERPGPDGALGRILKEQLGLIFKLWQQFKEGVFSRSDLQERAKELVENIKIALTVSASADGIGNASASFACNVLDRFQTLWTFLDEEGIEPTNNLAERGLRPAVIFRKISGGSQSEWGVLFIERLFTVVCTLKQQAKNIFEFLTNAFKDYFGARSPPSPLHS